jgi:hypothetical protein
MDDMELGIERTEIDEQKGEPKLSPKRPQNMRIEKSSDHPPERTRSSTRRAVNKN